MATMLVSPVKSWKELGLKPWLIRHISSLEMNNPTPIQQKCIPEILSGKNCIGSSQTGSGKTAAYALPIIQDVTEDPFGIHTLILTPTRELAIQLHEQISALSKPIGLHICLIIGGVDEVNQGLELGTSPNIVIATPGRLFNILKTTPEKLFISSLKYIVMDEVDALLSPGEMFMQMNFILRQTIQFCLENQKKPQILAFTATAGEISQIIKNCADDSTVLLGNIESSSIVENLVQRYVLTAPISRDAFLIYLLKQKLTTLDNQNQPSARQAIVFTQSCWQAHILGILLSRFQLSISILHSALPQNQRKISLQRFRSSINKVLVCTDLASRGLDIPVVDLVINYVVPMNYDDYIHRIGRTARAGRDGEAVTFVTPYETERWLNIQSKFSLDLPLEEVTLENNREALSFLKNSVAYRQEISARFSLDSENDLNKRIQRMKERRKRKCEDDSF